MKIDPKHTGHTPFAHSLLKRVEKRLSQQKYNRTRFHNKPDVCTIIDDGADQVYFGKGWTVIHQHNYKLVDHQGVQRPVVDAVATVINPLDVRRRTHLVRVNHGLWTPEDNESLIPSHQMQWHGLTVETSHGGASGKPCDPKIVSNQPYFLIPLLQDGLQVFFLHGKSKHADKLNLPPCQLTSPLPYKPRHYALQRAIDDMMDHGDLSATDSDSETVATADMTETENDPPAAQIFALPKPDWPDPAMEEFIAQPAPITKRRRWLWDVKDYLWKPHQLAEWRKRLEIPDVAIKKTFAATTQLAPSVQHENQLIPKDYHKARFPMLSCRRIKETVHADIVYIEDASGKRKQHGVMYYCGTSKLKTYYHLGPKADALSAIETLKQFTIDIGAPQCLRSDFANELANSALMKRYVRHHLTKIEASEPYKHEKTVERAWQAIRYKADSVRAKYGVPLDRMQYLITHLCDLHNHTAIESLQWCTPLQAIDGEEPDISHFRFHFWEPVWCLKGSAQISAGRQWVRARYLGTAWNTGDTMCFHVQFDDTGEKRNVVPRSLVIPRHPDERAPKELLQYKSDHFFPTPKPSAVLTHQAQALEGRKRERDPDSESDNDLDEQTPDLNDALHDHGEPEAGEYEAELRKRYLEACKEDEEALREMSVPPSEVDDSGLVERVITHRRTSKPEGTVDMKFQVKLINGEQLWCTYDDLKLDAPVTLARYIKGKKPLYDIPTLRQYSDRTIRNSERVLRLVTELQARHGLEFKQQSESSSKRHTIARRRAPVAKPPPELLSIPKSGPHSYTKHSKRSRKANGNPTKKSNTKAKKPSGRNRRKGNTQMGNLQYGVAVPRSVKAAMQLDKDNNNHLWEESIKKELGSLMTMKTFRIIEGQLERTKVKATHQFAPLRMIFVVKAGDLRRKARLVIGGHVVDPTGFDTYASNMKAMSALLLMTLAAANSLRVETGDIKTAYLYADAGQPIYTRLGDEFHVYDKTIKPGSLAVVEQALYGLYVLIRIINHVWNRIMQCTD
jgi:hypothetical protein